METLPCHDGADRLGATEDTGLLGPLQEGISGGEGVLREVQFEGPHDRGLQHKLLQKYQHPTSPTWLPYYKSTAFPTQIFRDLLVGGIVV